MATNRHLLDYLPPFMREFAEMKRIMDAEQTEVDDLWKSCDKALDEQFVATASEYGISRYERILGIVPKATSTLDERRFTISTRMTEDTPYTMTSLKQKLENLCGKDGYSVELDANNYILKVRIALTARNNYDDVCAMLQKIVPANMVIDASLMYNQNKKFVSYTHEQLKAYTHNQLRNEVDFDVE